MATRLEEIVEAIHVTLNDSSIVARVDQKALHENDQLRRLVWIERGGVIAEPNQAGGRHPHGDTTARVRACKLRLARVEVHGFGETREAAERIFDNLIAAICLTVPQVAMPSYEWVTQQDRGEGHSLRSEKFVLTLTLRLPVPDEISQLKPIVGVEHECSELTQDGEFPVPPP